MEHLKPRTSGPSHAQPNRTLRSSGGHAWRRGRLLAAVLVGLAQPAAGQQIYKWVDDKGVTQYTTTPPPGGKAQTIRAQPATGKPGAEPRSWKDQEIEFRARQVERAEAEHKQQQAENRARQEAARRRESCINAHRNIQSLQEQRPVYAMNEKGERQYLDDAQRAEAARKAKAFVDRECPK
jgi:hypothetical protein